MQSRFRQPFSDPKLPLVCLRENVGLLFGVPTIRAALGCQSFVRDEAVLLNLEVFGDIRRARINAHISKYICMAYFQLQNVIECTLGTIRVSFKASIMITFKENIYTVFILSKTPGVPTYVSFMLACQEVIQCN